MQSNGRCTTVYKPAQQAPCHERAVHMLAEKVEALGLALTFCRLALVCFVSAIHPVLRVLATAYEVQTLATLVACSKAAGVFFQALELDSEHQAWGVIGVSVDCDAVSSISQSMLDTASQCIVRGLIAVIFAWPLSVAVQL
jgi:hypothetical protein